MKQLLARLIRPSKTDGDVLTTLSGKTTWAAPTGSSAPTIIRELFTASTGSDTLTFGATPVDGSPLIWANRALLWPDVDYALSGDTASLNTPLNAGDELTISWEATTANPPASTLTASNVVAPTVRATTTDYTTSSTVTITIPAGTQVGDLLVVSIGDAWGVNSPPSGWTQLVHDTGSNQNGAIYYKTATSADTAGSTANFGLGGPYEASAVCVAVRGNYGAITCPWEQRGSGTAAGQIVNSAALSTTAGDLLLYLGHLRESGSAPTVDRGIQQDSQADAMAAFSDYAEATTADLSSVNARFTAPASSGGYFYAVVKIAAA